MAQWQYDNQRRKVANRLLNSSSNVKLSLNFDVIDNHFRGIFEIANDSVHDSYDSEGQPNSISLLVTLGTIEKSIKKISINTSSGVDGIVLRTIRHTQSARAICNIANMMLNWNYVPLKFRTERTIVIYKWKGHESDIGNSRRITIFSVLRRTIDRSLDQELRSRIKLYCH